MHEVHVCYFSSVLCRSPGSGTGWHSTAHCRPEDWDTYSAKGKSTFNLRYRALTSHLLPFGTPHLVGVRLLSWSCVRFPFTLSLQENLVPGQRHASRTPRTLTRNSLCNSGSSPLTSIQSSRRRHIRTRTNSPRSGSIRDGETPIRWPHFNHSRHHSERQLTGSPVLETPENMYFGTTHRPTSQNETSCIVRRCLFPPSDTPSRSRSKQSTHYASMYDDTATMDVETEQVIKTSGSRKRLKRL